MLCVNFIQNERWGIQFKVDFEQQIFLDITFKFTTEFGLDSRQSYRTLQGTQLNRSYIALIQGADCI